ncbi:cobalamin biosynthesis protein [Nocardia sp. XZ_19_385]|uniref:cobalamin biosynthesis protein n=1 Tax=Nocardia sp. XZ_19_385 TaxID=2769488 RepID=UPI00188F474B|nr:cobalamin biosynthesis protein [Nocardia sp. XZ_19_385]
MPPRERRQHSLRKTVSVADLVVGIGLRPGASAAGIRRAVREVLGNNVIHCLATIDRRAAEPGLLAVAAELGVPVRGYSAAELDLIAVPNPAGRTRDAVGTASVAEAAALLAGVGPLVIDKQNVGGIVIAAARFQPGSV